MPLGENTPFSFQNTYDRLVHHIRKIDQMNFVSFVYTALLVRRKEKGEGCIWFLARMTYISRNVEKENDLYLFLIGGIIL